MISTVAATDSSHWKEISLKGHDFKIPLEYENGKFMTYSYESGSFTLAAVDEILEANYGFIAENPTVIEDNLTIAGHPVKYIKYNGQWSRAYFPTGDSIYCIMWKGTSMTPEIEEIIATSAMPSISIDAFYGKLTKALEGYRESQRNVYYDMDPYDDIEDWEEYEAYGDW